MKVRHRDLNSMKKKLKCFISSNFNSDLSKIENLLFNFDIDVSDFRNLPVGSSFSDAIKRTIKESDFIIGLLTTESKNVLYELGIAEALGKPMFLLFEKDVKAPFFLEGKMSYQLDWSKNTQLLELSLKNYILDVTNSYTRYKKKPAQKENTKLKIDETNATLLKLKSLRESNFREVDVLNIIMSVLEELNIQAVSELALADKSRVDIAITNEGLSHYFGNPILIELKTGNLNQNTIENAQYQLQSYINKTDANFGILLYFDKTRRITPSDNFKVPNILMFDVEDFIQGISSEGFENFLIKTRNHSFHSQNNSR